MKPLHSLLLIKNTMGFFVTLLDKDTYKHKGYTKWVEIVSLFKPGCNDVLP